MDMIYPAHNPKAWGTSLTLSTIVIAFYVIMTAYFAAM